MEKTLAERVKAKVEEVLNKDTKTDPIVVERVNQIINDAVAGMPPPPPVEKEQPKEDRETALINRLKAQVDTVVKADEKSELAKKLKEVVAAVEPEIKKDPVAAPIPSAAPAPPKPAAAPIP